MNLLTQQEVAKLLHVSTKTLQKLRRSGELPCIRLSHNCLRYERAEVEKFIEKRKAA